jgi:hypothetical protein
MFFRGTKVRVLKDSEWHAGKTGTVIDTGNGVYKDYSLVECDGLDLWVQDKHIIPFEMVNWEEQKEDLNRAIDNWAMELDAKKEEKVEELEQPSKLRHLLTIKGTTHILTHKELKEIKNMLAGL